MIISVQMLLVLLKIQSPTHPIYVATEGAFNIYVGMLIIMLAIYAGTSYTLDLSDRTLVALGGFLLIYNIDYKDLWLALHGK